MIKYSLLGRKMNNELRVSYKKVCGFICAVLLLFIYVLNKNTCDNKKFDDEPLEAQLLPTIYCVTPTYSRYIFLSLLLYDLGFKTVFFFLPSDLYRKQN